MSFKLIAIGNSKQITDYVTMMQRDTTYQYKLLYKQPIDKHEFLVVLNCKQQNKPEAYHFPLIYVQAKDQVGVESFSLKDTQILDLGNGMVHIRGRLD